MPASKPRCSTAVLLAATLVVAPLAACKRTEPAPNPLKSQREAMERAKEVGTTMQKGVDAEARKADAEGK
jgi:hypothetical protein